MALDSKLTQNINLRVSNGDQLLKPLEAFGREINKTIRGLANLTDTFSKGNHQSENQLRAQVQLLQRLVGEASTLQNILTSSRNRGLLDQLSEQKLGRSVASASRLSQELSKTKTAADALDVRMAQLNKKFADLNDAGRRVGQRDLVKQLNTEEAYRQVTRLEQQIRSLDARGTARGGLSAEAAQVRAELQKAQDTLLSNVQNPRRSNWSVEIAKVQELMRAFQSVTRAEEQAQSAAQKLQTQLRQTTLNRANTSDPMLLAALQRGSKQYSFTADQARTFNMPALGKEIEANLTRLRNLRELMSQALTPNSRASEATVARLSRAWDALSARIAEALAKKKAFESLPEQRMRQVTEMLFADGGLAFGARIGGAALLTTGVFAVINAIQSALKYVLEYERALDQLQAIAGATDSQMVKLSGAIESVAAQSNQSTLEIAKAATTIAQAGYSAEETGKILKDALNLSVASGSSPAEAVDTLTSTLGAFQLQASESGRVVDTLVTALNKSKLSINQMQAAIQYAGATAKENGVQFEELATIAASLANAGIRSGSTIGTGLRQLLVDLQTPTDKFKKNLKDVGLTLADVDVKSKGFAGVVKTLKEAGFGSDAAFDSFETRAASAFLAFKNQVDTYDDLALSIAQGGTAAEAQQRAMDNLSSQFQRMVNVLGNLVSKLSGPFVAGLKVVTSLAADFFQVIDTIVSGLGNLNEALGGAASAIVKTGVVFGTVFALTGGSAIAAAIAGVLVFVGALSDTNGKLEELQTNSQEATAAFDEQQQTLATVGDAITHLVDRQDELKDGSVSLQAETATLGEKFEGLYGFLDRTTSSYDNLLQAMLRFRGEALKQAKLDGELKKAALEAEKDEVEKQLRSSSGLRNAVSPFNSTFNATRLNAKNYAGFNNASGALASDDVPTITAALVEAKNTVLQRKRAGKSTVAEQALVDILQQRLDLAKRAASLQAQLRATTNQIALADAAGTDAEQKTYQDIQTTHGKVNDALQNAEKGNRSGMVAVKNYINTQIKALEEQRKALRSGTAQAMVIDSDIAAYKSELSRLTRSDREQSEADAKYRPTRAGRGRVLSSAQVSAELKKAFPGIGISSGYRGPGNSLYNTRSLHSINSGNALDISSLPRGVSADQIRSFIEGLGLELAPGRNGFWDETRRPADAKQWTGPHYHFGWKAKTSTWQSQEQTALKSLQKTRAGNETAAATSSVNAIIAEGKAGNTEIADLKTRFDAAVSDYLVKSLAQYDVEHPLKDLSGAALTEAQEGRDALKTKLAEDVKKFRADFYRAIGDAIDKDLTARQQQLERTLESQKYDALAPVRQADSQQARLTNGLSRSQFGAGTAYYQQRQGFNAQLRADQSTVVALNAAAATQQTIVDQRQAQVGATPEGSEEHISAIEKLSVARQKLNDLMRESVDLQQSVNDRTEAFASIPLGDRLRESVAAWAENSGAMNSWGKTLEDNIGPALDMFSEQLATLWTSVTTGTRSVIGALGDFVKAFAKFVLQIIAKALALAAVKAILSAFGLQLNDGPGGATIGKKFSGGEVNPKKDIPGLIGGGEVTRGVSNRDSAIYNLARGEYVVRGQSVRDIGVDAMDAINRHGSKGLAKVAGAAGSAFTNIQAPRQETNVYVVKEDQQPPLGPNDILVTIHDDIMKGGPTKKLIKQVAQGG